MLRAGLLEAGAKRYDDLRNVAEELYEGALGDGDGRSCRTKRFGGVTPAVLGAVGGVVLIWELALFFPVMRYRDQGLDRHFDSVFATSLLEQEPSDVVVPSWMPNWLRGFYMIWFNFKEKYLDFFSSAAEAHCLKAHLKAECCTEIVQAAVEERWKIYVALLCAFLLGWGLFKVGSWVKPQPPVYWTSYWRRPNWFGDMYKREVDVTNELRDTIQDLFDMTTKRSVMGTGYDGQWVKHNKFTVLKVTRLENGRMWTAYSNLIRSMRKVTSILGKMDEANRARAEQALAIQEQQRAQLSSRSPRVARFLSSLKLDDTRNEALLFHGCPDRDARDPVSGEIRFDKVSPVDAVKMQGFDDRLGNISGMLGSGLYFADFASKADQYAGKYGAPEETTVGEEAVIFLARVGLGAPYLTSLSLNQMRRPPCIHGHFDANLAWGEQPKEGFGAKPWLEKGVPLEVCDHMRYDSVVSERVIDDRPRAYREYTVYGKACYPEFCVTYRREWLD
eukprot:TRINITY_DN29904_c0_g2_i1.p1 TRINITY_DN29904_c0_g2~~TRINITY_DN29904_c0_g2_i1.p1  ORF type:complete len:504 (-),score=85.44 TRINITY_DN29904_c0_g2_i1:43-1554(-)